MISEPDHPKARARARVSVARIEALSLRPGSQDEMHKLLRAALAPGTEIERYGRVWRMGQNRDEGQSIVGRLGFQAAEQTELWNASIKDFEEAELDAGTTSPFAIDAASLRVAFQRRGRTIRPQSFSGALQALMNEASPLLRWRVTPEVTELDWAKWVQSVDRVTHLRVRLERPNPHYADRKRVKGLLEGTNSAIADFIANASPDDLDGIDVDDAFIAEAIEHAEEYGSWSAEGETAGRLFKWRSDEEVAPETSVPADPTTGEASSDRLRRQVEASDVPNQDRHNESDSE